MASWQDLLMPKLAEVDTTFAEVAPVKIVTSKIMAANVADVWAVVTHNPTWTEWFPMMTSCETTSDPAFGVGATRTVKVGGLRADEVFVAWDENALWAFSIVRTNLPLATKMLEQIEFSTSSSDGSSTTITYTGAITPHWLARPILPLAKWNLKRLWSKGFDNLAAMLESTN